MALDQSFVGRTYPPTAPYEVGREKIREFAEAVGDPNPVYTDPEAAKAVGHPDVIAPPTFPFVITYKAAGQVVLDPELGLDYSRVVHGDQKFSYTRPVRAERPAVRDRGHRRRQVPCLQRHHRRARRCARRERRTCRHRTHEARVPRPGTGLGGELIMTAKISYDDVEVGTELPGQSFPVSRAALVQYAGASGDFNPIHWNEKFATSVGLPDVIAHGMFTMASAIRVVTDWTGDPGAVAEYGVRFTKPVVVPNDETGAVIEVTAKVGAKLDDAERTVRVDLTAMAAYQKVLGMSRAVVRLA